MREEDMARHRSGNRFWLSALDLTARNPWLGAVVGLALVAALVPILISVGGYSEELRPSIPLLFLIPMLVASTLGGRWSGIAVSVAAVLAWDWFFIPPLHQVTIYSPRDVLALGIFFVVAVLTGQVATVARERAAIAIRRAHTTEALYDLSTALIGSHTLDAVLPVLVRRLRDTFDLQGCSVLLRDEARGWSTAASAGSLPKELNIDQGRAVAGVLAWVEQTGQMSGLGGPLPAVEPSPSSSLPASSHRQAQFWPLMVGSRLLGVLELVYRPNAEIDPERDRLLATLVNGAVLAIEHERLFEEEQHAAIARESDLLKSALLSSVSHDLRTPLAGIKAAASSLLQTDMSWSEDDRRAFVVDIDSEVDRLSRLVSNLLDLSRIEAGALTPARDVEDVGELVTRVSRRMESSVGDRRIVVSIAANPPTVLVDPVHLEQAVTNLIENAAKYSPARSVVGVRVAVEGSARDRVTISVSDQGPGIPGSERDRIFDKFYRISGSSGYAGGTGMGLAIVKGLVEANGGSISVSSGPQGGTTFTIGFPAYAQLGDEAESSPKAVTTPTE